MFSSPFPDPFPQSLSHTTKLYLTHAARDKENRTEPHASVPDKNQRIKKLAHQLTEERREQTCSTLHWTVGTV